MNIEIKMDELHTLVEQKEFRKLKYLLERMNEADAADFLESLGMQQATLVFRMLPKTMASDVFAFLPVEIQKEIIEGMTDTELHGIVEDLYVDDAVDMLEELPATVVRRVLENATPETRKTINQFLNYPDHSAGSIMTAEYISLKQDMTVRQSFDYIRANGQDKESIYVLFITDAERRLEGVLTVKDLLMHDYEVRVGDIMDPNVIYAVTTEDQEEVVRTMEKYDMLSLGVVDKEGRLVGIVTVDDAVDVMKEEATEDIEKMAAMLPSEKPYFKQSVFTIAKNRIGWLLVLMVSSMITGGILERYEEAFQAVPLLVTFIPMLSDTGGNAGSQSSATIIRSMTLGEIKSGDALRVLWKEVRIGAIVGFLLAAVNFVRLMVMYPGRTGVCLTVVISLFATVLMAKAIGCVLPILAKAIHVDPANMASPLVTTIVDAASLLLYFQVACLLLGG